MRGTSPWSCDLSTDGQVQTNFGGERRGGKKK
jgi:hypothetical protein